jgi:heme exporter protein C
VVLILRVRLELNERRIRALQLSGMFDERPDQKGLSSRTYETGHNMEAKQ